MITASVSVSVEFGFAFGLGLSAITQISKINIIVHYVGVCNALLLLGAGLYHTRTIAGHAKRQSSKAFGAGSGILRPLVEGAMQEDQCLSKSSTTLYQCPRMSLLLRSLVRA